MHVEHYSIVLSGSCNAVILSLKFTLREDSFHENSQHIVEVCDWVRQYYHVTIHIALYTQPSKQIVMGQSALSDLSEGLQLMEMFSLPTEHMLSLQQLHSMVIIGPHGRVHRFLEAQKYTKCFTIDTTGHFCWCYFRIIINKKALLINLWIIKTCMII